MDGWVDEGGRRGEERTVEVRAWVGLDDGEPEEKVSWGDPAFCYDVPEIEIMCWLLNAHFRVNYIRTLAGEESRQGRRRR
jgi:hypothetical protein